MSRGGEESKERREESRHTWYLTRILLASSSVMSGSTLMSVGIVWHVSG